MTCALLATVFPFLFDNEIGSSAADADDADDADLNGCASDVVSEVEKEILGKTRGLSGARPSRADVGTRIGVREAKGIKDQESEGGPYIEGR